MAGILKKAMRGAAQAGAAASIEAMKAEITRKRDERLQSFQQGMQQQQWERDDRTRAEDRQEREASELRGITERTQNRLLDQENQERQFDIAEQGLEMDRERLDLTAQQIDQALRQGEFGLIEAQRLRGIQDIIMNPDAAPEEVTRAVEMLRNLKGGDPAKFQAITLYGETDDWGNVTRQSGVLNQATGQVTPVMPQNVRINVPPAAIEFLKSDPSPEAIREFDEKYGSGMADAVLER